MTHAFFKALLFLAAGVVIEALGGEHDIFKMGGLRRKLPVAFWAFLIGAASLAALPLVTAGFYSKDLIIEDSLASVDGNVWLWLGAVAGTLLTGLYAFRLVFVVFFGEQRTAVTRPPRWRMKLPLFVLSALAIGGGFLWFPTWLGGWAPFESFLDTGAAADAARRGRRWRTALFVDLVAPELAIIGLLAAWLLYLRRPGAAAALDARPLPHAVHEFWYRGWGFDRLYEVAFVRPVQVVRAGRPRRPRRARRQRHRVAQRARLARPERLAERPAAPLRRRGRGGHRHHRRLRGGEVRP